MKTMLVVLALLAAGCGSGGRFVAGQGGAPAPAHPRAAVTPAARRSQAPMSARVVLPSRTMTAGSSMAGHVVVTNSTGHAVHAGGCLSLFQVLLTSSRYRPTAAWAACLQRFTIPAGETRYQVTIRASYDQCGHGPGMKECLHGNLMPPLPPGTYHARLFQAGTLVRVPPAITVRVTPPEHR